MFSKEAYSSTMFQTEALPWDSLDINELLQDYLYLNSNLFKQRPDGSIEQGDACFKKFTNEGKGVVLPLRIKINAVATAIRERKFRPENYLEYIDLLTLYSNHIDQQRFNEKPEPKEKEQLVLNYLEAAFVLSPQYDYEDLTRYTARELSSHAQLLHYLGKARRYAQISVESRLPLLQNALKIAQYLDTLNCTVEADPHNYENRVNTYMLPICYSLQDLKKYDDAAKIIMPQASSLSAFHRVQAYVQLANIYVKKNQDFQEGIDDAEHYAHQAVAESSNLERMSVVAYNARVCLMNVLKDADKIEDVKRLAEETLKEMDEHSNNGIKPEQRRAVEQLLESCSKNTFTL